MALSLWYRQCSAALLRALTTAGGPSLLLLPAAAQGTGVVPNCSTHLPLSRGAPLWQRCSLAPSPEPCAESMEVFPRTWTTGRNGYENKAGRYTRGQSQYLCVGSMPNINVNSSSSAPLAAAVKMHFCNFASELRNFSEVTAVLSSPNSNHL